MQRRNIKTLIYLLIAGLCFVGSIYYSMNKSAKTNFLQTSVLPVLEALSQDYAPSIPIDLAITDVAFEKTYDPTPDFNYYKYKVDLTVKNYGGNLVNAKVVVSGDHNQKAKFIQNTTKGFYLQKDGTYVIRGYEVIFDGNYNGGQITLNIDAKNRTDFDLKNNSVSIYFLEFPPKINEISLKGISNDKSFLMTFANKEDFANYNFEAFITRDYSFPDDSLKYAETYGLGKVYGYYRTQNNSDILNSKKWQTVEVDRDELSIKFTEDLFTDIEDRYLYLKATNEQNGFYVFSNVIKFPRYSELSYEDFIKYLTDYAGLNVAASGALNGDYSLGKTMNRGDVLQTVIDSHKIKLSRTVGDQYFEDISPESHLYPYSVALEDKNLWKTFGYKFNPEFPATIDYLKYLVYEYRENR